MSCKNQHFIYTRAKYINYEWSPIGYHIPCGKCEWCLQQRGHSYFIRAFYEWQDVVSKGGYAYFDTLTYNEDNIPTIEGKYVFSRSDVRNFFKRLRSNIVDYLYKQDKSKFKNLTHARRYYNSYISGRIRYMLVCEFGETYGRPHYHPLFFINLPTVSFHMFRHLVRKSWKKGFIDTWSNSRKHLLNSSGAIKYLSEYVFKYSRFAEEQQKFFENLDSFFGEAKYKSVKRDIFPFIHCSINFGLSLLENISEPELNDRGVVFHSDNKDKIFSYALPRYYKRKLYYDHLYDDDGKVYWLFNELGQRRHSEGLEKQVKSYASRLQQFFNTDLTRYDFVPDGMIELSDGRQVLNSDLMDGRSILDLAVYRVYRYNRMLPYGSELPKLDDLKNVIDCDCWKNRDNPLCHPNELSKQEIQHIKAVYRHNSINESTSYNFRNFDLILKIFDEYEKKLAEIKCKYIKVQNEKRQAIRNIFKHKT